MVACLGLLKEEGAGVAEAVISCLGSASLGVAGFDSACCSKSLPRSLSPGRSVFSSASLGESLSARKEAWGVSGRLVRVLFGVEEKTEEWRSEVAEP